MAFQIISFETILKMSNNKLLFAIRLWKIYFIFRATFVFSLNMLLRYAPPNNRFNSINVFMSIIIQFLAEWQMQCGEVLGVVAFKWLVSPPWAIVSSQIFSQNVQHCGGSFLLWVSKRALILKIFQSPKHKKITKIQMFFVHSMKLVFFQNGTSWQHTGEQ